MPVLPEKREAGGLANLVLVVWRAGDRLSVVLIAIAQSTMGKFDFCSHALLPVRSWRCCHLTCFCLFCIIRGIFKAKVGFGDET